MEKKHTHRAMKDATFTEGWAVCVTPAECNARPERQAAHGCVVIVDTCRCGAVRLTEWNGAARNKTDWQLPR